MCAPWSLRYPVLLPVPNKGTPSSGRPRSGFRSGRSNPAARPTNCLSVSRWYCHRSVPRFGIAPSTGVPRRRSLSGIGSTRVPDSPQSD